MTRARILIMDDDPLFRSLLATTLRKDYLVSVAADGAEGYSKAVEHLPDLAVIDLQMPVCDGLTVLKAFRAHATLRHIQVMIVTSDNSKESVMAAIQLGTNDYLIKSSFNTVDFRAKVARLLADQAPRVAEPAPAPRLPTAAATPTTQFSVATSAAPARVAAATVAAVPTPAPLSAGPPAVAPVPVAPVPVAASTASSENLQSILDTWD